MTSATGLVLTEPRSFQQRSFELPHVGADDGLLRIEACGLCGTDHEQYTGHITETLLAAGKINDGTSIVNIASLAGMVWNRHLDRIAELDAAEDFAAGIEVAQSYERGGPAAYTLSKEWVVSYTKHLAGQVLDRGIRVNSVSPGPVDTPLFPYFEQDTGVDQMAWLNERVGRLGTPQDEAEVVTWLLVGDSGWVNGVDLPVDGGLSAGMTVGWANPKDSPASRSRRS